MAFGFIQNDKEETFSKENENLIVPVNFTNAIFYGMTGTGKTTCGILPNIEKRISENHGILIYDFKGNIHEQVKVIANKYNKIESIYEIGKPWGQKIDILKDVSEKNIESMFNSIGQESEYLRYWSTSACSLFTNIYSMLNNLVNYHFYLSELDILKNNNLKYKNIKDQYEPTLSNIFNYVRSAKAIVDFFEKLKEETIYLEDSFSKEVNLCKKELTDTEKTIFCNLNRTKENFNKYYNALDEYRVMKKTDETGGKYSIITYLNSILQAIATNDAFSSDEFDIFKALNEGKIVIINVAEFSTKMLNFFNHNVYSKLITRVNLNQKTPITVFIDEAQKVLSENSIPDVDVCRENNFEFIFATQDISLLEKQIGQSNAYMLLRNIACQYSFKTTDMNSFSDIDTTKLNRFECVDLLENKKIKTTPLYIDDNEKFDAEYKFQQINKIQEKIILKEVNEKCILKYCPQQFLNNKIILVQQNGNRSLVEYTNDWPSIENLFINIEQQPVFVDETMWLDIENTPKLNFHLKD